MPLFRRGSTDTRGGLSDRDLDEVIALVAARLGPGLVQDPGELRDPDAAARVDLPDVIARLSGQPRTRWPEFVDAYYSAHLGSIQRGHDLEARASGIDGARRYVSAILELGDPASRVGVALPGILPGTRYVLCMQDGDTVRVALPSNLAAWGITAEVALDIARDRARSAAYTESQAGDRPSVRTLDTAPSLWSSLVLEVLADAKPEAVGPLGTLAALLAPNVLVVRPLTFGPGLRDDLTAMAYAQASWLAANPETVHRKLLWRRITGQVVEIDMEMSSTGERLRLNVADPRFLGVLTAIEPSRWLPVAAWAPPGMTVEEYTRFAGVAAAMMSGGVLPDQVASASDDAPLAALARICMTVEVDDWPRVVGMSKRIGVRTSREPDHDLSSYPPRAFVEAHCGDLPAGLRSVIEGMPGVVRVGMFGGNGVRASESDPARAMTEGPFEVVLVVLVGHSGDGDVANDIDLLQAACAVFMPLGVFTAVEPTHVDDPRFLDTEHLLPLV